MTNLTETIRARHAAAMAKAAKLRNQLDAAVQECREMETALKVIEELEGIASKATKSISHGAAVDGPTMPELILLALEEGPKPIAEVTATVTDLSDKEVEPNNIRSTAWRMWKAGRIEKTGDLYHLIGQAPEGGESEELENLFN